MYFLSVLCITNVFIIIFAVNNLFTIQFSTALNKAI